MLNRLHMFPPGEVVSTLEAIEVAVATPKETVPVITLAYTAGLSKIQNPSEIF